MKKKRSLTDTIATLILVFLFPVVFFTLLNLIMPSASFNPSLILFAIPYAWAIWHISQRSKEKNMKPNNLSYRSTSSEIETKVVGVTFSNRQEIIKSLYTGDQLYLVPEPVNPHDRNAIMVCTKKGYQLGYIDKDLTHQIHSILPYNNVAYVKRIIGKEALGQSLGVVIRIPKI